MLVPTIYHVAVKFLFSFDVVFMVVMFFTTVLLMIHCELIMGFFI